MTVPMATGFLASAGVISVFVGAAGGSPQGQSTDLSSAGSHLPSFPLQVILTETLASVSQVYVQVVALSPSGSHFLVVPVGAAGAVDSLHSILYLASFIQFITHDSYLCRPTLPSQGSTCQKFHHTWM